LWPPSVQVSPTTTHINNNITFDFSLSSVFAFAFALDLRTCHSFHVTCRPVTPSINRIQVVICNHFSFALWTSSILLHLLTFISIQWVFSRLPCRRLPHHPPKNDPFRKLRHITFLFSRVNHRCRILVNSLVSARISIRLLHPIVARNSDLKLYNLHDMTNNRGHFQHKRTRSKYGPRTSKMHSWKRSAKSLSSAVVKLSSTRNLADETN
jgi:hypothetical protein